MIDQITITRDLFPIDLEGEDFFDILKEMPIHQIVICLKSGYSNLKKHNNGTWVNWVGSVGESYMKKLLLEDYLVDDVTGNGNCGDFLIYQKSAINQNNKILIEVKNCKNYISTICVQKFKSYISINKPVGGLFISLNHVRASGIEKFCQVSFLDEIPIINLCSSNPKIIKMIIQILWFKEDKRADIIKICELTNMMCSLMHDIQETKLVLRDQLAKTYNNIIDDIKAQIDTYLPTITTEPEQVKNDLLLNDFWKIVKEKFPKSALFRKDYHKFGINNIIKIISEKKKSVSITVSGIKICFQATKRFMEISPYIDVTIIDIKYSGKSKWRTFHVDIDLLKNNNLELATDFAKNLSSDD
jgi:hypothetical protein